MESWGLKSLISFCPCKLESPHGNWSCKWNFPERTYIKYSNAVVDAALDTLSAFVLLIELGCAYLLLQFSAANMSAGLKELGASNECLPLICLQNQPNGVNYSQKRHTPGERTLEVLRPSRSRKHPPKRPQKVQLHASRLH